MPAKRLFDLALASTALLLATPVMILVALAIKVTSKGPVLYCPTRVGQFGRTFRLRKFRTMQHRKDAENQLITAPGDQRIYPFGAWLRLSKLDELPQLWNVIIGEMSVVGPRPEDPAIVAEQYGAVGRVTLDVPQGLTSPGALFVYTHGDDLIDYRDPTGSYATRLLPIKLGLDAIYVRDQSFAHDLRVLARTVTIVTQRLMGRRHFPYPRELENIDYSNGEAVHSVPPPSV